MHPYIGITGFSRPEEVSAALRAFPVNPKRKLMIGVLATYKSLRGIPIKPRWAKQIPNPANISSLFPNDERALNLVHFSTEEGQYSSILVDMFKISELAGPNFHGFQLNLAWPETRLLDDYRAGADWNHRIVLQIGRKAVEIAGGTPQAVVEKLYYYISVINDILFDLSGGRGEPLNVEYARDFLLAIREEWKSLGIGVAGGLGPDSLDLVKPLVAKFPDLSMDAEGRLRNTEDDLDLNAVDAYLTKASWLVA